MEREIKTLDGLTTKEILSTFNTSFSDYFISLKLTEEQLNSKMLVDKTNLSLSVGVFENKKLIAFILHGIGTVNNKKVAYNGGTGVIPEKRGSGLTKQMYRFILPLLKKEGVAELVLEVIAENIQAIKSYERSGFKIRRRLLCYKGKAKILNTKEPLIIRKLNHYVWELMESFWEINPTWQNSKSAVDQVRESNVSMGAYIKNQLVAYVIYSPHKHRIQQIAVSKSHRRRRLASALISELINANGNNFSIINVDDRSHSTNSFLKHIGLDVYFEQFEMKLILNNI